MSKNNPLAGLIGHYDSEEDSDEEEMTAQTDYTNYSGYHESAYMQNSSYPTITHPAPIPHCAWSACYDESSGFTYYWNQQTNAVTWEAPPEYLLALKLAQQQLQDAGSSEVSAEEWQLYQQALAEKQSKQNRAIIKPPAPDTLKSKLNDASAKKKPPLPPTNKRHRSDSDEEKIELITSYHNSDSESNDEVDNTDMSVNISAKAKSKTPSTKNPIKTPSAKTPSAKTPAAKTPSTKTVTSSKAIPNKKQKTKAQAVIAYGPALPSNQEYVAPIGPELPVQVKTSEEEEKPKPPTECDNKKEGESVKPEEKENINTLPSENDDSQDENILMEKLRDKAKILENLGGELPNDIKNLINDEVKPTEGVSSDTQSPKAADESSRGSKTTSVDTNIDDLLEEIEKKELQKIVKSTYNSKIDMFSDDANLESTNKASSGKNSPQRLENGTDHEEISTEAPVVKPLFPSSNQIIEESDKGKAESKDTDTASQNPEKAVNVAEKRGSAIYMSGKSESDGKKKIQIFNTVVQEKKVSEVPSYTTKYSQFVDGFSIGHTGLGFSQIDESANKEDNISKETISYGQGLTFTKGEVLNDDKKASEELEKKKLEHIVDMLEAKLKFLNQQSYHISPIQEMTVQMQTLYAAFRASALQVSYWRRWLDAAVQSLARLESSAAPAGWICEFQRSEGCYRYVREADGYTQWEYPGTQPAGSDDMDICTTPPPPPDDTDMKETVNPPLPLDPPPPPEPAMPPAPPPPPPPPPAWTSTDSSAWTAANSCASWTPKVATPPPPMWDNPPPPGCDDEPPLPPYKPSLKLPPPPPPPPPIDPQPKESLGDELMSFYNDLAELEKKDPPTPPPPDMETAPISNETSNSHQICKPPQLVELKEEESIAPKVVKKKSKVKISSSVGLKHKTVSNLVAKWQQVADEINSD